MVIQTIIIYSYPLFFTGGCDLPIGMSDNNIKDSQITASSYYNTDNAPYHARLLNPHFWRPSDADQNPWLQISLTELMIISAIVVDGEWKLPYGWIWVEKFYLTHSINGKRWIPYQFLAKTSDNYEFVQKVCFFFFGNKDDSVQPL